MFRYNVVGQWAVTTSIDFSLAQLIAVMILLATGGANGGGYVANKYVVIGIHGGILFSHALINSFSIHWVSYLGTLAAFWNILGTMLFQISVGLLQGCSWTIRV
jgi:hypothetical protein